MLSFTHIKQGFWEIFRKIFEGINKFVNKTPDMFIRKFNFITEKFTNNNYEEVFGNNFEEIFGKIFDNRLEKKFTKIIIKKKLIINNFKSIHTNKNKLSLLC